MTGILQDLRYALRQLRKSPGFTAVAVIILALGIGANTAIFSAVYVLLVNPFNFPEANRIVQVHAEHISGRNNSTGYRDFLDWQNQNQVFSEMAITPVPNRYTLTGQGEPQTVSGGQTTANLLRVLRVQPALGRFFTAEEDVPDGPNVTVLTYPAWQRYFGGDRNIIGRSITLDSQPFTVVGVLPRGFALPGITNCEFFSPLREDPKNGRGQHQYGVVARLRDGVTLEQAQANMTIIARRLEEQYPATNTGWRVAVRPLRTVTAEDTQNTLVVFTCAGGLVLLLACINLAGLLLARASARAREISVRLSLGASRLRIVRQTLTESILLELMGGLAGLLLASWLMSLMRALAPAHLALETTLHLDPVALGFAFVISVLGGIAFGLAPAWHITRTDLYTTTNGTTASVGHSHKRFLSTLVVAEVALSFVVLAGAGLLIRSLVGILRLDTGVRVNHVVTFRLDLPYQKYSSQRTAQFYQELVSRLKNVPGVSASAAVGSLPMTSQYSGGAFQIEGKPKPGDWMDMHAQYNTATPGYFNVMRIPLLLGRDFSGQDTTEAMQVAIINSTLAHQFFAGENPIGRRLKVGDRWRTIVGVAEAHKHQKPTRDPEAIIYFPHAQSPARQMSVVLLSAGSSSQISADIRGAVNSLDSELPILRLRSMQEVVNDSVSEPRLITSFLGAFAALSLVLASVGIYGLLAFWVVQRRQEMGVRLALGASRGTVLRLVLRRGAALGLIGVLFGILPALFLARFLSSMLYGISWHDTAVFVTVPAVLFLTAVAAGYFPARRATKVDPMEALRCE